MQVGDGEPRVQRPGAVADRRQRGRHHLVHPALDDTGAEDQEGAGGDDEQGEQPVDEFAHGPPRRFSEI